jgi:hypothetical protein
MTARQNAPQRGEPLTWQIRSGGRYRLIVSPLPTGEIVFDLADLGTQPDPGDNVFELGYGRACSNLTVDAARDLIGRLTRAVEHLERQGKASG